MAVPSQNKHPHTSGPLLVYPPCFLPHCSLSAEDGLALGRKS